MKPVSASIIYRECVEVIFDDGNRAIFEPYTHGIGYQIEGLRTFTLIDENNNTLCKINSRLYRAGPMEDENKISEITNITPEKVAEYWKSAKDFVTSKFYPKGKEGENYKIHDDYWYHWRVVTEGYFTYQYLKEGNMQKIKE